MTRLLIAAGLLVAITGCGKQGSETPKSKNAVDRVIGDVQRSTEREARRLHNDLDEMAAEARNAAERARTGAGNKAKQEADKLSDYAARMAEDAKDRAMDIPDAIDEFFGTPGRYRADWKQGKKGKSGRK